MKESNICDSIYVEFWKRQNYRDGIQFIACQGFREGGGMNRWSKGDFFFYGSEDILYDTVMLKTWHYAFAKTNRSFQQIKR